MTTLQAGPSAQTIACVRCGGAVPLSGLAPRIRCPYCAHDQPVPPERLAQLAGYQRSVGDLVARLEGEQTQRAQWATWYGPDGKARGGYLAPLLIFGSMAAVYAVAMLLWREQVIDEATMERVLPYAILGVFFVGMGGTIAWNVSRGRRVRGPAPRVGAQCPRCGGPLAFEAGHVSERCVHCGAPLVAGAAIMHQAIDVARADLRTATMARYRLERSAMSKLYRSSATNVVPYIVLGSFLPMTVGAAIAFTVDLATNERSDTPAAGLAVLWLIALANAGGLALVRWLRQARRRRWRAIADAAALRLSGRVSVTGGEWVDWLNALWAGPYAVASLFAGPCFHAVTGHLGGFPVALDLDPVSASSELGGPRADILVAACLPGDVESVVVPPDLQQRAAALGFSPSSCAGGFVAAGSGAVAALKHAAPDAAADAVVAAARLLVEWATRVGAKPATPIP
jgi:hypothetical protein